jgi:hypothetical protein
MSFVAVFRPAVSTPVCRIVLLNMIETCLCFNLSNLGYCADAYDDFYVFINLSFMSMLMM